MKLVVAGGHGGPQRKVTSVRWYDFLEFDWDMGYNYII